MSKTGILSIALDLGSTAIKTAALNENGELTHIVSRPAPVIEEHLGHLEKPTARLDCCVASSLTPCLSI